MFADAMKAIQHILLIESRIDLLQSAHAQMTSDMRGLNKGVDALSERVARIEGFIEGAAAASRPKRLPKRAE